jgi:hypothetical protein
MEMDVLKLKKIMQGILSSHPHEIGCDDCFQYLDAYVEMILEGGNASQAYPEVHEHLLRCGNCHEEFLALLTAIQRFTVTK